MELLVVRSPTLSPLHLLPSPTIAPHWHVGNPQVWKHASLPAKVDSHLPGGGDLESQEAKRRRRRASHNLVERRRRDNINERIQVCHTSFLSTAWKTTKSVSNLSTAAPSPWPAQAEAPLPLSLQVATAVAQPRANITMGLPIEEKEKGPNKGDILNGAVSWTRDLMWALHVKYQQEAELAELIASLGGTWPFEQTEEEKRR